MWGDAKQLKIALFSRGRQQNEIAGRDAFSRLETACFFPTNIKH